jgi:hypothetical protein
LQRTLERLEEEIEGLQEALDSMPGQAPSLAGETQLAEMPTPAVEAVDWDDEPATHIYESDSGQHQVPDEPSVQDAFWQRVQARPATASIDPYQDPASYRSEVQASTVPVGSAIAQSVWADEEQLPRLVPPATPFAAGPPMRAVPDAPTVALDTELPTRPFDPGLMMSILPPEPSSGGTEIAYTQPAPIERVELPQLTESGTAIHPPRDHAPQPESPFGEPVTLPAMIVSPLSTPFSHNSGRHGVVSPFGAPPASMQLDYVSDEPIVDPQDWSWTSRIVLALIVLVFVGAAGWILTQ